MLNIGQTYNFNTLAPQILGVSMSNVLVNAIMSYQAAAGYFNPSAMHAQVYPFLPSSTLNDPTKFTYYLLQTQNNQQIPFADEWIDQTSVKAVTNSKLTVVIQNAGSTGAIKIQNMLVIMGYTNLSVTAS